MKRKNAKMVCALCQEIVWAFSLVFSLIFSIFNVQTNDKEREE